MARAQPKDAVSTAKFYFRKEVFPQRSSHKLDIASRPASPTSAAAGGAPTTSRPTSGTSTPISLELVPVEDEYEEMSINEIINGKVRVPLHLPVSPRTGLTT